MADTQAYWDGARWTTHVAPIAQPTHSVPGDAESDFTGLWHAGWITALLIPIVGFIIGAVLCSKPGMGSKGVGVMLVALMFAALWGSLLF